MKKELLAPNGKPSKLTPEQYKLVRTPAFKKWFGDWENDPANASKVIDEETKEPLVVYHGTPQKNKFYNFKIVECSDKKSKMQLLFGSHFASKLEDANIYKKKDGYVYEVFLNIRNILDLEEHYEKNNPKFNSILEIIKELKLDKKFKNSLDYTIFTENGDYGGLSNDIQRLFLTQTALDSYSPKKVFDTLKKKYDGICYIPYQPQGINFRSNFSKSYIAFEPNQIKLADGSNTTFDANNDDIRYASGGGVKKISNDRKISTIKTNVKSIVKALSSYLKENDIKYDLDIAKTGSSYFTFEKCNLDFKIRIANHTKGYTGDEADEKDIFIGYRNILIDNSINGLNSKEIIDIIEKSCIYYPLFENVSIKDFKNNLSYLYGCKKPIDAFEIIKQKTGVEINFISEFFYYNTYNDLKNTDVFINYKNQKNIELEELQKKENYLPISEYNALNGVFIKTNYSKKSYDWKYNYDIILKNNNLKYMKRENELNYLNEAREELLQKINNNEFKRGGRTIAQTPAPKKERIYGSNINKQKSSESNTSAKQIVFDEKTLKSIKNKVDKHNEENPDNKITLSSAKAVVRRGMGAYSKSHRPTIKGGKPNSRVAWGLARLNAFIYKIKNGVSKSGKYIQDDDLINELNIKYNIGGEISKQSINNVKNDKINYLNVLNSVWSFFGIKLD